MIEEEKPIVTICPKNFPGTTSVLTHYNVSGLVEHTDEISPETIRGRKLAILGGWTHGYYEALKKIKTEGVPVAIFWTSSVGQTDFSNGGIEVSYLYILKDMIGSGLIEYIICATPSVRDMFDKFIPEEKVIYMPYAFDWDVHQKYRKDDMPVGKDWVDLFCPGDTRKNILVQTHGAKIADVHLHYSGLSTKYRYFADLIKVRHTDMGWMKKPQYYKAVQTMKLGMQVTYAETFDYVVAEHFAMKRPCLISTVMGSWVDKSLWKDLMVYNIDDPFEVGDTITAIMNMTKKQWKSLTEKCYLFMKKEAKKRNNIAIKTLEEMIE